MEPKELTPGATLQNGKYIIESVLGKGGFGITYLATYGGLKKPLAVKELFLSSEKTFCSREGTTVKPHFEAERFEYFKTRFKEEAQTLTRFEGVKGIVQVFEIFEENDTIYLAMEYLRGKNIAQIVKEKGPFTPDVAVNIATRVLATLTEVHNQGLLHRDISPSNIIIDERGEPVLLDFGIAREFDEEITLTQTTFLTVGYSAPEQGIERARRGPYTDVYSVGATLYYMLTGERPQTSAEINISDFIGPNELNKAVSPELDKVVEKALKQRQADRYQSCNEFLQALERLKLDTAHVVEERRITQAIKQQEPVAQAKHVEVKAPVIEEKYFTPKSLGWFSKNKKGVFIGAGVLAFVIAGIFIIKNLGGTSANTKPFVIKGDSVRVLLPAINYTTGKMGFIDTAGKVVIDFMYDKFDYINYSTDDELVIGFEDSQNKFNFLFQNGVCARKDGKWCFIDSAGKVATTKWYDEAEFYKGRGVFKKGTEYSLFDKNGVETILPGYELAFFPYKGYAPVMKNKMWGCVDSLGKEVIPCMYDRPFFVNEGLIAVTKDSKHGFIDISGNTIIPFEYDDDLMAFKDGVAGVKKDGKWGFINKTGKELTPFVYDGIYLYLKGPAVVKKEEKYGFVDRYGKEIIPPKYDEVSGFYDGFALVGINEKFGFVNIEGEEVIPLKYDRVWDFTDGLAVFLQGDKKGFINKKGEEVVPAKYSGVMKFSKGIAGVMNDGKWAIIDKKGNEITPFVYEEVRGYAGGMACVKKDGKYGYVNNKGKEFFY